MKSIRKALFAGFLFLSFWLNAQQATYRLTYDPGTQTYTFAVRSNTAYNPPLSVLSSSTQVSIVIPDGWQATNVTPLTAITWSNPPTYIDGTQHSLANDYMFFAPTNSIAIAIPANAYLDLFSFQSASGCIGDLSLFDNNTDPLNGFPQYNADNNFVVLAAGGNIYAGNDSGAVACSLPCAAAAGTLSY